MDVFCEYLVKKKSAEDNLKKVGIVFACIVLCFAIFFGSSIFPQLITFMPILIAAAIFGAVWCVRNFSIEYEYIFINGTLDIDVIKGRAKRKQLISIPCRKIEYMGRISDSYSSQNKKIDAIYDASRSGKYVITFSNDGVLTDVFFQPPEKLLTNMKKFNPRNINL